MAPDGDSWPENRTYVIEAIRRHDRALDDIQDAVNALTTSVAEIKASNRTWALVVSLVVAIATVVQVFVR